jgi:hypothetical protein
LAISVLGSWWCRWFVFIVTIGGDHIVRGVVLIIRYSSLTCFIVGVLVEDGSDDNIGIDEFLLFVNN